jgi:hypothetical protein
VARVKRMKLEELKTIGAIFEKAVCPEDVFGTLPWKPTATQLRIKLRQEYRKLAKVLHPDMQNGDREAVLLAKQLFQDLSMFHQEAERRINDGTYGVGKVPMEGRVPIIIRGKYVREGLWRLGDLADVHLASLESSSRRKNILMKAARTAADNDLLLAEREALEKIRDRLSDAWKDCVPKISDSFLLDEKGYQRRRVNVMNRFDGFLDCTDILKRLPKGVDGRTFAWMWKRLLVLLEWTSKVGLIHGAVLPPHVMFYPDDGSGKINDIRQHSVRLVDWCYAILYKDRTRLSAWVPAWESLYPPEVLAKEPLGPWTDLYMGAATMVYLMGGSINSKGIHLGSGLPASLADSLVSCLHPTPSKRPQSIGKYFEEFRELLRKEYGAPRFHEFVLPT